MRTAALTACLWFIAFAAAATEPVSLPQNNVKTVNDAFAPGEKLTYSVSWSSIIEAGVAVMEVKEGRADDGARTYRYIADTRSVGLLDKVYPVREAVESIVDADRLASLSYNLQESHSDRKRSRVMLFDRAANTVRMTVNNDAPETFPTSKYVQDALSSLYYVRTIKTITVGKPIVVDVFDGGKTWTVELQVLGRERIKTPAGEFDTVKVKTYPKYDGVFRHKGEIFIWFTDDARKIPVLMQSTISIGSIMATLTGVGNEGQAR
jgi:hypothetical protein